MDASDAGPTLDQGVRLASALHEVRGVARVVLCGPQGELLGVSPGGDGAQDAALATYIAGRGEALSTEGGLRGMGRVVSGSSFHGAAVAGPWGEALVLAGSRCHAFVVLAAGAAAQVVTDSVRPLIGRAA